MRVSRGREPADWTLRQLTRNGPPWSHEQMGNAMDLQALHDKIEIRELLSRYARGVDTKDWELWKSVFTPDATLDYSSAGAPVGSRDELAAWLERGIGTVPMTQHFITNVEIQLDGDRAKVLAMFYNP